MTEPVNTKEYMSSLPYIEIDVMPGLKLRQLNLNDANKLFSLTDHDREYLGKWLPWVQDITSPNESTEFIKKMLDKRASGEEYGYGIELDEKIVGHISLMNLKNKTRQPEIGYWAASSASGKGIATKTVTSLTRFGLDTIGLEKIIIRAHPDNIASNKVAAKAGYKFSYIEEDNEGSCNVWVMTK